MKQKYIFTFKGPDDPADKLRRKMTVKAESLRDAIVEFYSSAAAAMTHSCEGLETASTFR